MEDINDQDNEMPKPKKRRVLLGLVLNTFGILISLALVYSIVYPILKDLYYIIVDIKSFYDNPVQYLAKMDFTEGGWKLVIIGFFVFLLKKFQQFWFGVLEFVFAFFYSMMHYIIVKEQAINNDLKIEVIISMMAIVFLSANSIANVYDGYKLDFFGKKIIYKLW